MTEPLNMSSHDLPKSGGSLRYEVLCDVFRSRGSASLNDVLVALVSMRNFRPVFTARIIQRLSGKTGLLSSLALPPLKFMHRWFCGMAAIDFSHRTQVGPGLCITHGWGLVISPHAQIGANCTLFHGVTIARNDSIAADGTRQSGYPVIEDDCWIGPHACILGQVTVGEGAIVGAGAVVVDHVPPHSVVAGNPARVVRSNATADVFNRVPGDLLARALGHNASSTTQSRL